jgi:nitric oxide reductase NorE protein
MTATVAPVTAARRETHLPGDQGMWVFVLGDLVFFGVYFIIFMVYRHTEPKLFLSSQRHLNLATGAANTLVLLASSRCVALAVHASRAADPRRGRRLILYGGIGGAIFVVIKTFEWSAEISRGFTLPRNDFFMFYYMLTGVHMFHVLLGLGTLGVAVHELGDAGAHRAWVVEAVATYWHMVDVVWIMLFALVYVMR